MPMANSVRTTIALDAEVLEAARRIAAARSESLGAAISNLARRGLRADGKPYTTRGFPVFQVSDEAAPITLADVRRGEGLV